MKILLIGGTGVLSSAVAEASLARGDSVSMINRGNHKEMPGVHTIFSDRHDYNRISKRLKDQHFDVIVDFLVFNASDSRLSYQFYSKLCDHYVLVSSCFVYDFTQGGIKYEDSPRGLACWQYSQGKCEAEDVLVATAKHSHCQYTIVRPFVTYGNTRIPYSLAPSHGCDWTLIARAKAGKPLLIWNDGLDGCNIMRVEDFCEGLLGLFLNERAYGEAVNICGDDCIAWREVVGEIEDFTGIDIPLLNLPRSFISERYVSRKEEIDGRSFLVKAANDKLKELVPSFSQKITLREGVAKTLVAYQELNYQDGIDWNYDATSDFIVNSWYECHRVSDRVGFVNYLHAKPLSSYRQYLNASPGNALRLRAVRKLVNGISRCSRGLL